MLDILVREENVKSSIAKDIYLFFVRGYWLIDRYNFKILEFIISHFYQSFSYNIAEKIIFLYFR